MRPVAEQQEPVTGSWMTVAGRLQRLQNRALFGARLRKIAADDGEVRSIAQRRVARPGLEQRREALDAVQPPDRQDEREAVARARQAGDGGCELGGDGVSAGPDGGGRVERPDRNAFRHGAHEPVTVCEAEELGQLLACAGAREQGEAGRAIPQPLYEAGTEQQMLAQVGVHEAVAIKLACQVPAADERVRIGCKREEHGQVEPLTDSRGGEARHVGEAQVDRVDRSEPAERELDAPLELAPMRPRVTARQRFVAAERHALDAGAGRHPSHHGPRHARA